METQETPPGGGPGPAPGAVATRLSWLFRPVDAASLAFFRVAFGLVMLWDCWRYASMGRIPKYWIEPAYHFPYELFEWVTPWPGMGMYLHFAGMALLALLITLGLFYRASMALFFLAYTYVFLLDESTYNNHYYLISILSLVLVFVPCHRVFSLDARRLATHRNETAPFWALFLVRFMIGVPYLFGGLAKLNPDWLVRAEPLRTWLRNREALPYLGPLLTHPELSAPVAYLFAWSGLLLDLLAVPLLCWGRTRPFAMLALLGFHVLNSHIFSIGIFPWLMVLATPVFFPANWPRRIGHDLFVEPSPRTVRALLVGVVLALAVTVLRVVPAPFPFVATVCAGGLVWWTFEERLRDAGSGWWHRLRALTLAVEAPPAGPTPARLHPRQLAGAAVLGLWVSIQVALPLRHFLIPGNVSWTEEGHRFAWHMKLRDKAGAVRFFTRSRQTGEREWIHHEVYLEPWQESEMRSRPYMIRQFARYLSARMVADGSESSEVYVEARASLNGRPFAQLVDPEVDLASERPSYWRADWILPLDAPAGGGSRRIAGGR